MFRFYISKRLPKRGFRGLATWGERDCHSDVFWDDSRAQTARCLRIAHQGETYNFANTFLCPTSPYYECTGGYLKNNNTIVLTVKPRDRVGVRADLVDYDWGSPDERVCTVTRNLGLFTAQQLSTLNASGEMSQAFNGDGACTVKFTLKRAY